jgi:hypothetical protein
MNAAGFAGAGVTSGAAEAMPALVVRKVPARSSR